MVKWVLGLVGVGREGVDAHVEHKSYRIGTYVCYLTAKARPEHTIASMAESKRRTPMGGKEFAQEVCSKRGWDDDAILLEK